MSTFFTMLRPTTHTLRPKRWAASRICWIRWMWDAKAATTMRPSASRNTSISVSPTVRSDSV